MSICGVTKVEWPCVATDGCHVALASESGDEPLKYVPSQREISCGLRLKKARYRHSAGSWRGTSLASARNNDCRYRPFRCPWGPQYSRDQSGGLHLKG